MMKQVWFILVLFFVCACSVQSYAQHQNGDRALSNTLPPLAEPADCELLLRYIDDAITRSTVDPKASFIVLVKSKKGERARVSQNRVNGMRWYLQYRGLSNFEIAATESSGKYASYDLFVLGRKIYSIPLRLNAVADFRGCMAV